MFETADPTHKFELTREYSTPYNALIRDDVVMGVPRYFLERWLPVLGTNAATVVNTLRQLHYRCRDDSQNGHPSKTVIITGAALAGEAAMSRRHLYTCLETDWIPAFIRTRSGPKTRNENGKITQQANSYLIRIDDPLNPADADHLCQILTKLADTPLDAAQHALELNPRTLWAPEAKQKPERFTQPRAITARDVLQRAFPLWIPPTDEAKQQFAQLAEALHRHITLVRDDGRASKIIVPQYFRKRWWSHLGHDLAWAYLWLRGCVYDNPEEGVRRDTCWIPSLDMLLDVIGRPREWWRRNVESRPTAWGLDRFFAQQATQKGRDPSHPQWVARQFKIALDIPIAPEDQERYAQLLNIWQDGAALADTQAVPPTLPTMLTLPTKPTTGSTTSEHTDNTDNSEVCHIQTHRDEEGLPHSNTPDNDGSATSEHTGSIGVCHIHAQGSATFEHRNLESNKAPLKNTEYQSNSKHQPVKAADADAAGLKSDESLKKISLIDQLAEKNEHQPETPLYACAPIELWLQQAWIESIRPHTPAWNAIKAGQVLPRDMLALMLAIWADRAIKHPPRYLSWLIQRWQAQPDAAPVDQWERWQALADMPIGQWMGDGQQKWLELAPLSDRALPFGLDALLWLDDSLGDDDELYAERAPLEKQSGRQTQSSNGLDERPGNGTTTINDIWQATLSELSAQINRSTYQEWVEGTQAVSYTNGVLTVQAKHVLARDWLSKQLNASIEATASALANIPITLRYIS